MGFSRQEYWSGLLFPPPWDLPNPRIKARTSTSQADSLLSEPPGKVKVKVTQLHPTLCDPMDYSPWNSPGQNTGAGSLSLLQGIFPTQGSKPGLPYCRRILHQLSHKGSPIKKINCDYFFTIRKVCLGRSQQRIITLQKWRWNLSLFF